MTVTWKKLAFVDQIEVAQPNIVWLDATAVRVSARTNSPAGVLMTGFPNILHPGQFVNGDLTDGKYRANTANVSMDFAVAANRWGTEKASQYYCIYALAAAANTVFTLKAMPIMRFSSQNSWFITLRNNLNTANIGYGFTTDELVGGKIYVLSGEYVGEMRTITANNNDNGTAGTITYGGGNLPLQQGDWFVVLPPGVNFRFLGDIYNNSSLDINSFVSGFGYPGLIGDLLANYWKKLAYEVDVVKHSLATAANDFLVASGAGVYVKKTLAETLTILGKAAASGLASLDASAVVVEPVKLLKAGTGALAETDGAFQWHSTKKIVKVYDTQRERGVSPIGWLPYAYQIGGGPGDVVITPFALAAQYDCIAFPVVLEAPILLESVTIRQTDIALARTWRWTLHEQYLNDGNAAENSLTRVVRSAVGSFTPVAASNETTLCFTPASPVYLPPGDYWLVIQNTHATNALTLGTMPGGTMALNTAQTKLLGAAVGTTLDFVAATWANQTMIVGARLNGRVFGETTSF